MADNRLKTLQDELIQKETELRHLRLNKMKQENTLFHGITQFFNPTDSYDEQNIKNLEKEIADLKIQIENNTSLFDTLKNSVEKASKDIYHFFKPDSVIKAEQMAQLEKSRETANQIREKYNLPKKA